MRHIPVIAETMTLEELGIGRRGKKNAVCATSRIVAEPMTLAVDLVPQQVGPCARRRLGRVGFALRFLAQQRALLVGLPR